jgi:hypothetical protein
MSGLIHYFCTAEHSYPLGIFTAFHAGESGDCIRLVPYRNLPSVETFGPGTFIFTDLDRVSDSGRESLLVLADHLRAAGCAVLNHPATALGRFDLLRGLHDAGINRFDVHRLADWQAVDRFPVFIRREAEHGRAVTGLLESRDALRDAVRGILAAPQRPRDLMIVEFGNAPAADGSYRKYSAFRVGERVYGQVCQTSLSWWVNFENTDLGEEPLRIHFDYLRTNPHRDPLMRIFRHCGIDYGRADYCMVGGDVQIFEINTNPTVIQGSTARLRDASLYVDLHEQAMLALAAAGAGPAATPNPLFRGKARSIDSIHAGELAHVSSRWAGGKATASPGE